MTDAIPERQELISRQIITDGINTLPDELLLRSYREQKKLAVQWYAAGTVSAERFAEQVSFLRSVFCALCSRYENTDKYAAFEVDRYWLNSFASAVADSGAEPELDDELTALLDGSGGGAVVNRTQW